MSLAQLVPNMAAPSSNFMVSAKAGDQTTIEYSSNIDWNGFMATSHSRQLPMVKRLREKTARYCMAAGLWRQQCVTWAPGVRCGRLPRLGPAPGSASQPHLAIYRAEVSLEPKQSKLSYADSPSQGSTTNQ